MRKIVLQMGIVMLFVGMFAMPVMADTITVCASGCNYTAIQAAINAAGTGDLIEVGDGTYDEQLVINESVTLTGNNSGTILQPSAAPAPGVFDVKVWANDTTIQNFTFDFNGAGDNRGGMGFVISDMLGPDVLDTLIRYNTIYTGDGSGLGGTGIQTGKYANTDGLTVSENIFYADADGYGEGIYINPHNDTGTATISDNEFYGLLYSAISIEGSNVVASDNLIDSNSGTGIYGIRIFDLTGGETFDDIEITDNTIYNVTYGIRVGNSADTGSTIDATISGNSFTDNTIGYWSRYGDSSSVSRNKLYDNTNASAKNSGDSEIDLSYNYWGRESGPAQDEIEGDVDYQPYYIDSIMTRLSNFFSVRWPVLLLFPALIVIIVFGAAIAKFNRGEVEGDLLRYIIILGVFAAVIITAIQVLAGF